MHVLLYAVNNTVAQYSVRFFFVIYFLVLLLIRLSAQFTDDPTLAICNDSGGSVFELSFK